MAGDVAAEHEDDAELADCVGEGEEGGGEQGAVAERENEGAEDAPGAGAQAGGGFGVAPVDAGEAGDEGLDGEGEAVDEGSGDEAGEAKGEGVAEEAREEAAGCGERAEADQKIEAEDGGWEDEREGDQSLDKGAGEGVAARQPPGDGDREEQKEERGGEGELEGEDEGLRVHGYESRRIDLFRLRSGFRSVFSHCF